MARPAQDLFINSHLKYSCGIIKKSMQHYLTITGGRMFTLSQFPLPFAPETLAPYMSAETVHFHHDKHVATYINNLNELIAGTEYENLPLHEIIIRTAQNPAATKIFNNAAQVYNHDFFFHCLRRDGDIQIPYEITKFYGGPEKFRAEFKSAATSVFGSGWTWLVREGDNFKIMNTANADTPIAHGLQPVLTLDVWEHAYYLDYQNRRADFCDAFLDHLINWEFVLENMKI